MKIIKNNTASPIILLGVTINANSEYTIPIQDEPAWASSDAVVESIGSGDILVNDGHEDLGKALAVAFLQGNYKKTDFNDDLKDSGRLKVDVLFAGDQLIKVSSNDQTSGYLEQKIVAEAGAVTVSTLNDGADEDLQVGLPSVGTASTYGSASQVPVLTTDSKGRVSSVTNTSVNITASQVSDFNEASQDSVGGILSDTSNITLTYSDVGNTISSDLTDTGVSAASYGGGNAIPVLAIDAKGRITSASTTAPTTTLQQVYNNSTNPEIVVDSTRGAVSIRDASSSIAANLFEVHDSSGLTPYLEVSPSKVQIIRGANTPNNVGPSGNGVIYLEKTTTNSSATPEYTTGSLIYATPASASAVARYIGASSETSYSPTAAANLTTPLSSLIGQLGGVEVAGSAAASTITNTASVTGIVRNISTNHTITNAKCFEASIDPTVTNRTSGVTNLYGFYMEDQSTFSGIPAAANRWGMYIADVNKNYVAGSFQSGDFIRPGTTADTTAGNIQYSTTYSEHLARMASTWRVMGIDPTTLTSGTGGLTTTSATYATITGLTTTPTAGTYLVYYSVNAQISNNSNGDVAFFVDNNEQVETTRSIGITGSLSTNTSETALAAMTVVTLNGTNVASVRFRENGGGTLTVTNKVFILIPIAR
jgi:hypothetical protein